MTTIVKPRHAAADATASPADTHPLSPHGARALLGMAVSAQGMHMLLNLSAMAGVLMRMHGMKAEHRGAMLARLQHFLRMGFPFVRTQRAGIALGIEEALKLAVAFQLVDAGFAPTRAVRLMKGDWVPIRTAIAEAWSALPADARDEPSGTELEIFPNALAEIASTALAVDAPLHETGTLVGAAVPGSVRRHHGPGPVIRLDVGRMADRLAKAVVEEKLAPRGDVERAFEAFVDDVTGTKRRRPRASG